MVGDIGPPPSAPYGVSHCYLGVYYLGLPMNSWIRYMQLLIPHSTGRSVLGFLIQSCSLHCESNDDAFVSGGEQRHVIRPRALTPEVTTQPYLIVTYQLVLVLGQGSQNTHLSFPKHIFAATLIYVCRSVDIYFV